MTDVHALSGAYAIDALDDLERAKFERHLSECSDCQAEVASLREVSALLADSVITAPPPSLRDSVLAGITTVRPIPPVVVDRPPATRPRPKWQGLLVAAAAVTVLGSGVAIVQPWDDEPERSAVLTPTEQVLRADDAQRIVQEFSDGSKATVVISRTVDKAVIVTEGMAAPPAGSVYQLWYQRGADMVPAGVMPVAPDVTKVLDGDTRGARAVGISVEPEGTTPDEPTTKPVAVFSIPT